MCHRLFQPFIKLGILGLVLIGFWIVSPVASAGQDKGLRESAVVKAVRRVSPIVVNISSEYEVSRRANPFGMQGMDRFFDSFFRDFLDPGYERRAKRTNLGSGVIIDAGRGYILTNAHVVTRTGKITVLLKDEREFEARIVGADPDSDLAVLKIESKTPLPDITLSNCDDPMIGETVIAIGNPFGFSHTVTTGVISALNRSIRTEEKVYRDFIQTDASINPGNSGGPLLNINGELVGINTAIYASGRGIGFAIPISKARRIIDDLIRYGEVIPAWIGLTVQNVDERLTGYLDLPNARGVMVKAVTSDSPAARAGIREGDVIRYLGEKQVASVEEFNDRMKAYAATDTIPTVLWRNGREVIVSVTAVIFPQEKALALAENLLGVRVADLTAKNRRKFRVVAREGVVIAEIARNSYLAHLGAGPGDVIRQIDEMPVENLESFKKAVVKYRQKRSLVILLQRADQLYYVPVEMN